MPDWETIAYIASALAVVIALLGFIWQIRINVAQRRYDQSAYRLTSSLHAFEEAEKLLKDGNNDRVTWVAAARALERGIRIAADITEQVHFDVFEVERDRYRRIFGDFLGSDNPEIDGKFFYGAPNTMRTIDEAAKYATARANGRPQIRNIPERILRIFWDFAQFPDDYEDPISHNEGFSDEELAKSTNAIIYPGLIEYLRHTKEYMSIGGQLRPRKP